MRLFIQEFVTGGGLNKEMLDVSLLVEGFGMLRVLLQNAKNIGMKTVTTLDKRLVCIKDYLNVDEIILVSENESIFSVGQHIANKSDGFLVIAPGANGILADAVSSYNKTTARSYNCSIETIQFLTNKAKTYEFCSKKKINIPRTIVFVNNNEHFEVTTKTKYPGSIVDNFENYNLKFPIIIKPNEGVACEGLVLCRNREELERKLNEKIYPEMLIQEYIYGEHLSVTALIRNDEVHILSINEQKLSLTHTYSAYLGGISNIRHPFANEIIDFCYGLLKKIDGLQGFVGIDFVISTNENKGLEIYFIEINPRTTTPVCGLLNKHNKPIQIILDKPFDYSREKSNVSYFAKSNFNIQIELDQVIYSSFLNLHSIVTPPLKAQDASIYTLIRGWGKNAKKAKSNFDRNTAYVVNTLKSKLKHES
jgi:predicted ATP-grasp superfamily ATP-dependent carboligase